MKWKIIQNVFLQIIYHTHPHPSTQSMLLLISYCPSKQRTSIKGFHFIRQFVLFKIYRHNERNSTDKANLLWVHPHLMRIYYSFLLVFVHFSDSSFHATVVHWRITEPAKKYKDYKDGKIAWAPQLITKDHVEYRTIWQKRSIRFRPKKTIYIDL